MNYFVSMMTGLLLLLFAAPGFAHKVVLFAWVEGNSIQAEAGFGSKRPAKQCEIKGLDSGGRLVFQGKTDDAGKFSTPVPRGHAGDMILELSAGPGHKGTWTIRADEFGPPPSEEASPPAPPETTRSEMLDKGPEPIRIIAGIGIIFGLAVGVSLLKKRRRSNG